MSVKTKTRNILKPNIGLSDKSREASIEILNGRLADSVMLYTKLRKYHWNVTGIHFESLHELFQDQYKQIEEAIDDIAERVRQLGGMAIGTLEEFKKHSALKEEPGVNPDAEGMVQDLLNDHETIITQLRKDASYTDEELGDLGTSDFLIGLIQRHEKMAWMLRAHLES